MHRRATQASHAVPWPGKCAHSFHILIHTFGQHFYHLFLIDRNEYVRRPYNAICDWNLSMSHILCNLPNAHIHTHIQWQCAHEGLTANWIDLVWAPHRVPRRSQWTCSNNLSEIVGTRLTQFIFNMAALVVFIIFLLHIYRWDGVSVHVFILWSWIQSCNHTHRPPSRTVNCAHGIAAKELNLSLFSCCSTRAVIRDREKKGSAYCLHMHLCIHRKMSKGPMCSRKIALKWILILIFIAFMAYAAANFFSSLFR